ncbi:nucleoside 2-deoxyribosyltransferase domain-containing protein [Embleya sp. NPDC050493]|uniref:nucleoside 2-deoxyribosyltransferase domain-containing protein n=1 Tax=Embleya sp. NPDC050493 TaxID=3363989 RepID=UPI00378807CC
MTEIVVVNSPDEPPDAWDASVFLAGPTPRAAHVPSWRPAALKLIRERRRRPGRLVVFVPEPGEGQSWPTHQVQRDWELRNLDRSDRVLFWIPRDLRDLPGLTTNDEWGWLKDSGRAVLGTPPDAPHVRYQRAYALGHDVPVCDTLPATVDTALDALGLGAPRTGGERDIPLNVWLTRAFEDWYAAQRAAGNTLLGGRIAWVWRRGAATWLWAAHVKVAIAAEGGRVKDDEVVLGRPDVTAVVLYRRAEPLTASTVVLVREFRSAARTKDGFVHELPGGSGYTAADGCTEVGQETGLALSPERLRPHGSRQLAGTLTAHHAHVYSAELTEAELAVLRSDPGPHGVAGDGERTDVEITTYGELLRCERVDWSTLGMLAAVLTGAAEDQR